ncbi:uncharacterized protein [Antedon mediterranea]|uniref:uncharacterized protein n=1 Tax=Antedon mediterranea TaxID=105859 RepID=UPI003AF8832B
MCDQEVSPVFYDGVYSERLSPTSVSSATSESSTTCRRSTKGRQRPDYKRRIKPPHSYMEMIRMAINSSPSGQLTLREIINFMYDQFACFRGKYVGWKNSVRHNLSASECFTKILRDPTRPYGKDNYWTMNDKCGHCKSNNENEAACQRILATSKHNMDNNYNKNILNLVINKPRSPIPRDTASDEPCSATSDDRSPYTNYQRPPTSSEAYYGTYYDQHFYAPLLRHQNRYHPYTSTASACYYSGRYTTAQPCYIDDLAMLEDLYVPAADIDISMYNHDAEAGKDCKLQHYPKEQPQVQYPMFQSNVPRPYDYHQYYAPTSLQYQYPSDYYTTGGQRPMFPPASTTAEGYVHPYPFNFATTTSENASLSPISPSSSYSSSSLSSVSSESDLDQPLYLPSEALAVIYGSD